MQRAQLEGQSASHCVGLAHFWSRQCLTASACLDIADTAVCSLCSTMYISLLHELRLVCVEEAHDAPWKPLDDQ